MHIMCSSCEFKCSMVVMPYQQRFAISTAIDYLYKLLSMIEIAKEIGLSEMIKYLINAILEFLIRTISKKYKFIILYQIELRSLYISIYFNILTKGIQPISIKALYIYSKEREIMEV